MQFPGKLTNQTSENGKEPNFGPNFSPFGPNLLPPSKKKKNFVNFTSASICTLFQAIIVCDDNDPNSRKWRKTSFLAGSKLGLRMFFFKNLASSVTKYHGQL